MATVERLTKASITRDPAFTKEMFDAAVDQSFARTAGLRGPS
jgi:hypothetical protein